MISLKPMNKQVLLLELDDTNVDSGDSTYYVPEEMKEQKTDFRLYEVVDFASDIRIKLKQGDKVLINDSMVKKVTFSNNTYLFIDDNSVLACVRKEK